MAAATKDKMELIHGYMADIFVKVLTSGETAVDKETGEVVHLTPSAAHLSTIRQFLKDNGIEAAAGTNKKIQSLVDALPFPSSPAADEAGEGAVKH